MLETLKALFSILLEYIKINKDVIIDNQQETIFI